MVLHDWKPIAPRAAPERTPVEGTAVAPAGGCVIGLDGSPLRYGKKDAGFKNDGFIAWGRKPPQ